MALPFTSVKRGGEIVANVIEKLGMSKVFVEPGSQILPILDYLDKSVPEIIGVINEGNGVVMADVVGRITGKPAVVLVTAGPGVTNCVTGVAQAYTANSPLLLVSARNPPEGPTEAFHGVADPYFQERIFEPITKYTATVKEPKEIEPTIIEAYRHSISGRFGPSYVAVVDKVLNEETEFPEHKINLSIDSPTVKGSPLSKIVNEIVTSKAPLIFAGKYVIRAGVQDKVEELAKLLASPVIVPRNYPDAFPYGELYAGSIGQSDHPSATYAISTSDLVISVGIRVGSSEDLALRSRCNKHCNIIYIDIDNPSNSEVDGLFGDMRISLEALISSLSEHKLDRAGREERIYIINKIKVQVESEVEKEIVSVSERLNPLYVIRAIERSVNDNFFLIGDAGAAGGVWLNDVFRFRRTGRFLHSRNYDSMGFAVPGSIGAKIAAPEADVVAVTGDGSFLLGVSDLGLVNKLHVNPVIVVFNDSKLGLIWKEQIERGSKPVATELPKVNISKIAEAMGLNGVTVSSNEEFYDKLQRALTSKIGTVIEVPMNSEFPYPSRTIWKRKYF
ncbi:thiamine pyrophosphate-binding protein [Metallosphaera javensis (ex Sakai et al. 2022)]|uniref:thiamine pyrophosphate-binding protein n=1 Tax=Metallosphaera javensis (ex Sakai et al. 2022) TaxID=2775498 RepID=UPI002590DFE8|nr:MAG: acetolactate synthase [Metallosphaera javensis (ex Sakai et al. 2022)]